MTIVIFICEYYHKPSFLTEFSCACDKSHIDRLYMSCYCHSDLNTFEIVVEEIIVQKEFISKLTFYEKGYSYPGDRTFPGRFFPPW